MRRTILWNEDWVFEMPGRAPENVTFPHTWNGVDGQDGGDDYKRCACTYRKRFLKPEMETGGSCLLHFRGVNSRAEVVLNGVRLAGHEGGYSSFVVDLTENLKEENVLQVTADNRPNDRVYPQFADFTFYGGIYRDVELILTGESYFAFGEHCAPPVRVTARVEGENGRLLVQTRQKGAGQVRIALYDAKGGKVLDINEDEEMDVGRVHLWDGICDPYLYTVRAELVVDGNVVDKVEVRTGFRSFRVDPDKGFILNHRPYKLQGVCRHQDRPVVGNAITREMQREDMELLLDLGATTVRLTHYQHDQYFGGGWQGG